MTASEKTLPNAAKFYRVTRKELPLSCPMPTMSAWDSHPRVFLPIEEAADHRIRCPYCSADFELIDP